MDLFETRAEIERLRDRVYELEQTVAELVTRSGGDGARMDLREAVAAALAEQGYTAALMAYRGRTSAGLAEAKAYVDRLRRELSGVDAVPPAQLPPGSEEVIPEPSAKLMASHGKDAAGQQPRPDDPS